MIKKLHAEMRDHFTFSIKSVILQQYDMHFIHFLGLKILMQRLTPIMFAMPKELKKMDKEIRKNVKNKLLPFFLMATAALLATLNLLEFSQFWHVSCLTIVIRYSYGA